MLYGPSESNAAFRAKSDKRETRGGDSRLSSLLQPRPQGFSPIFKGKPLGTRLLAPRSSLLAPRLLADTVLNLTGSRLSNLVGTSALEKINKDWGELKKASKSLCGILYPAILHIRRYRFCLCVISISGDSSVSPSSRTQVQSCNEDQNEKTDHSNWP